MSRTMYDSVNVQAIPANAEIVAGYVSGRYKNFDLLQARFPHAICVPIATKTSVDATVLDVERYDATPAEAPTWCERQRARGQVPTVYTPMVSWPDVVREFRNQNVLPPQYWIARWDNKPTLLPGAVAKQYGGAQGYDLSVVEDYWPGVDVLTPQEAQELLTKVREIHDLLFERKPDPYGFVPGMDGRLTDLWVKAGFPKAP